MKWYLIIGTFLCVCVPEALGQQADNWTAKNQPCLQSAELAKRGHMELGVWMNTSNTALVSAFARAMDFWAGVLDMTWRDRNTPNCSIQVVDGNASLFGKNVIAARSQLIDRPFFHGWIAFNPQCRLTQVDLYLTAIHELGHILGLQHSSNPKSVMYFLDPENPPLLDKRDLALLASRHKLRNAPANLARSIYRLDPPSARP